jgi:methylase of polypeptide subunit release factors
MASSAQVENKAKSKGVHYTPPELASFLARAILRNAVLLPRAVIFDPGCGDGGLLHAIASALPTKLRSTVVFVGMEDDEKALQRAAERLSNLQNLTLLHGDFLHRSRGPQFDLFHASSGSNQDSLTADVIITNPPYVRTQVLGAARAQKLAREYNLRGRVDLYHAFVRQLTNMLRPGGTLGLLCSNRFMFTLAGDALRQLLSREYQLEQIYDLGDTKLFPAAVLPAIIIGKKNDGDSRSTQDCPIAKVYEAPDVAPASKFPSVLNALEAGCDAPIGVGDRTFSVSKGRMSLNSGDWQVRWHGADWMSVVADNTDCTFGDFLKIRVGIKTTADSVFVRDDWDKLPRDTQPEPELLRPLITHHTAARWRAAGQLSKRVLYPHRATDGRRYAIDLLKFPRTANYLHLHRQQLENREYVIEAGRKWYEIWVPQDPSAWAYPKIVFPDISETPKFFLDTSGAIVNGDCYWGTVDMDHDGETVCLLLAVANSSLAVKFYDAACGNKLYASRRRFMTQYVNRFPIPKRSAATGRIVELVNRLLERPIDTVALDDELDSLVWRAFGLTRKNPSASEAVISG